MASDGQRRRSNETGGGDGDYDDAYLTSTPRRRGSGSFLSSSGASPAAVPPGAAGLVGMFAPPPPPPPLHSGPATGGLGSAAVAPRAPSLSSAPAAAPSPHAPPGGASSLQGLFVPPRSPLPVSVGINEEAASGALPPAALRRVELRRDRTERSSNVSTSPERNDERPPRALADDDALGSTPNIRNNSLLQRQRAAASASGDRPTGEQQGPGASIRGRSRSRSDATESSELSTRSASIWASGGGGGRHSRHSSHSQHECGERQALLAAHALTETERYLAPSTDLHALHDLFRPPSVPSCGGSSHASSHFSPSLSSSSRRQGREGAPPGGSSSAGYSSAGGAGGRGGQNKAGAPSAAGTWKVSADDRRDNGTDGPGGPYAAPPSWSIPGWGPVGTDQLHHLAKRWCSPSRVAPRCTAEDVSSTLIGSFTFVLFQIVFCVAESAAVAGARADVDGSGSSSVLGPIMKTAALGALVQGPVLVWALGSDLPALYPSTDLFLAPFLAQMAAAVDGTLAERGLEDDDETFLATFMVLNLIGLLTTAALNVAASKFKLANLGAFLPYSVICGFFTYVGLTLWMMAFAVDTGGTWNAILFGGDWNEIGTALLHHLPSLVVGTVMCVHGPKYPALTPLVVLATIFCGYAVMLLTGTTLDEAQRKGWFYTREDFVDGGQQTDSAVGFASWAPPAPFGMIPSLFRGNVCGPAVLAGLPSAFAMAAMYLLRCSLHAAALKKSCANLIRMRSHQPPKLPKAASSEKELVPEDHDVDLDHHENSRAVEEKAPVSMVKILLWYGNSLGLGAFVGGFGVLPGVAVGATLFKIGAAGLAPQYGSIVLLFYFYITNFELVRYIPKPAFSCLLVLCSLDMIITWFFHSFSKTKNKGEWAVVPAIVVSAFIIGQLMSVALGVALSTFIFVAHIHRAGVVKFLANGLTIRSTIERSGPDSDLLDTRGDLIQVLVLQNYLFFGNANSCLDYISTMFEEPPVNEATLGFELPPIPRYLIIDFTIVTGMDTSAVDVFADIISLCKSNKCEVLIAGCSPDLKSTLAHGGVKPTRGLRFLPDMESALGKAEDGLLKKVFSMEEKYSREAGTRNRNRLLSEDDDGFRFALRQIDEQHGISFASELLELQKFTSPVELDPGQSLFDSEFGFDGEAERGLFFIEHGLMKVERDPSYTMARGSNASLRRKVGPGFASQQRVVAEGGSIGQLNARTATIGREAALLKATASYRARTSHSFRLARIGPGWVVGAIEGCSGLRNPGIHVAVTSCRLHHLPFSSLQELERKNPSLVLRLFKMMSHIMSRRQELTIEQLATLRSIMTSSSSTKPVSRVMMGAIQNALSYQ